MPDTAHTPRAHIINQRTVEILRDLGISERFHAVATPQPMMRNNLWVTTLAGTEVARSETWGTGADRAGEYFAASPEPMANCPQTVLEPLLLEAAREAGADIRFETEFVELEENGDGVTSRIRDRRTDEVIVVRSRYVIGADGARSKVAEQADLHLEGPTDLARAVNVWFRADLSRYLAHRPGVLTWNVMPGPLPPLRLGTLICHKPFTEFVLAFLYDPERTAVEDMTQEELAARIDAVVGEHVDAEILGVAGWQVNAQVATSYQRGRILCMGDAVHRHPPTNGLGLNMSIADAYNLAWKLALDLDGRARPGAARQLHARASAGRSRGSPPCDHQSAGGGGDRCGARPANPGSPPRMAGRPSRSCTNPAQQATNGAPHCAAAIELSHYQFNAHGIELGYRYESAVLTDDGVEPEPTADPQLFYRATSRPGARVPHASAREQRRERLHSRSRGRPRLRPADRLWRGGLVGGGGGCLGGRRRANRRSRHRHPRRPARPLR